MKRAIRPGILALVGLVLGGVGAEDVRPYRDPNPLPIDVPVPPPIARPGGPDGAHAPADGVLAAESAAVDHFGAEQQRVTYRLPAGPAANFSLFEVQCLGFSRGWAAGVELAVLDAGGRTLLQRTFDGGASFGFLVPQALPPGEASTLVLTARRASLRYALVRHGGFEPNEPGVVRDLGAKSRALGYLADGEERVTFELQLAEGEPAVVTVGPLREQARDGMHAARLAAVDAAIDAQPPAIEELDRLLAGARAQGRQGPPHFWPAAASGSGAAPRQRIDFPAGPARSERFDVLVRLGDLGGLFQLQVERNPERLAVEGRVGDLADDPRPGVAVRMLLEPDLETAAHAVTDLEGRFAVQVPPGEYSVLTFAEGRTLRSLARITSSGELNLVHEPEAEEP
ncbi:MAG: hypothetical protein GC161_01525 [Planctomycetaceae bacterium]|nr:hypothetical protein [Planctomycetaceae bacterium]